MAGNWHLAGEMLWTRGILLLVCLWFSSLDQNLADAREITPNMMPDAVDDQYYGCTDDMERKAPALLEQELNGSKQFRKQWENTATKWEKVTADHSIQFPPDFTESHGRAVIVYTDKKFHTDFMNAVKKNGKSSAYYKANFKFKAVHYYLTRALHLLREKAEWRYTDVVYRGTKDIYQYKEGEEIRFGHFTATSSSESIAKEFGTTTFYTIHTTLGVNIMKLSYNASQKEVLIPVNEVFTVFPKQGSNRYVLKSTGRTYNHLNCAYSSSGGITFPGQMRPSLLGGAVLLLNAATLRLFAGA
ncbi:T-cell ecto-ADP-ribosyltransferase 1 [Alligator mississippiensis]|uniref:T-cell ecto-ADP-ribosyltransferase 1 n=1 Tax=Alligator mississippiensis TaxID=8496 RepID=UPI0028775B46|nr:T-cell ecto-ADP-ribosyltransferase 1 [Alligator mississippiensis]